MSYRIKPEFAAYGLAGLLFLSAPLTATAGNLGIAAKAGTLGLGLEADYIINDKFSVRVQGNQLDYDYDLDEDGIEYQATLELATFGALLDWHPFGGAFRVSIGGYSNGNEASGVAGGPGEYQIGDDIYVVDDNDEFRMSAEIGMGDSFAPYAGIGWGHSTSNDGGLLLSLDVGVLFQGETTVNLTASGSVYDTNSDTTIDVTNNAEFQNQLRTEEANLQDDLSDFDIYPVITFGIGYRF
ncbi:hypothetical protein FT643_12910 [Ketobacter sp. MCCC 1A13808]|uniref:hypothetical protein n=1 Tax=Ketobacter sp. MCCC 1A13808 TaxID=2602738 RepID=UPI000F190A7E|nr:hypothetical protein [Ketobacter sp. MCCC 1A13808]MVF13037.1 hypothetical protein [Ketobacter sp. MCCC 1A13808]RLP53903.1 MAG: hypothetical protein D6160_13890 [Ketobacter sp.]